MDVPPLHQAMLDPALYPEGEGPVEFRETHASRLYLTGQYVYKVKKPVDFGFLDFTTLERRHFFCREEVRLNRRFAPGTYLGVLPLCRSGAGFRIGGDGEIVDYAVHMRRLPADRMLDRRLAANDPALPTEIVRVGERIAGLHAASPVCIEPGAGSNLATVRFNWQENFRQAAPLRPPLLALGTLDLLSAYVDRFLAAHAARLAAREENGFVRDGHGDLHAEHICLTDPIRIYDCIEFNRRFRVADTAADLAFLLMDLEFRGRGDLARVVERTYIEMTRDPELAELLPFYKIYRAFVRGKVEAFLAGDAAAAEATRREAASLAAAYFSLALGYLCPPVLIAIGGLMGTGKSTVAAALRQALGARVLHSDVTRKELAGEAAATGRQAPFETGIYTSDFSRRTYDRLLALARQATAAGTVVVDASFRRREERRRFREMAAAAGIPFLPVRAECDRQTAIRRLEDRQQAANEPSDGRPELYDLQARTFEPLTPEEGGITIDTRLPVHYNVQLLLCEIASRAGICR